MGNRRSCSVKMKNTPFAHRKNKYYLRKDWWYVILVMVALCVMAVVNHNVQHKLLEWKEAQVLYVLDGDTVIVKMDDEEQRVRLIGVDAPESVSSDEERNSVYGQYASEYTKNKLQAGQIIYLTFDKERIDPYNRILAYVWLTPEFEDINNLYQIKMVTDGYALSVCYEPNTMYHTELNNAMSYAVAEKNGLWAYEEFYEKNIDNVLNID